MGSYQLAVSLVACQLLVNGCRVLHVYSACSAVGNTLSIWSEVGSISCSLQQTLGVLWHQKHFRHATINVSFSALESNAGGLLYPCSYCVPGVTLAQAESAGRSW
jgi:hypothetical protein